jgi:ammonium transporter
VFKIADLLVGNRVSHETELEGLDIPEMGVAGYNGFDMDKVSETLHPRT